MREGESNGRRRPAREIQLGFTGSAALGVTLLFYLALQPFGGSMLNDLFTQRGWVPYGISFLSAWAGVMLVLKFRLLGAHRRALELDLLPESVGERITPDNAEAFIQHLDAQPISRENPLGQRIRRALLHFAARRDTSQLVAQLGGQAQADADALESSYTLVRVFIWAVPILGFIGTVIGIGSAVGGFSESVGAAVDLAVMKESIGNVTGGLGVAFDTTLVALVMSILIMFPASSLQKAEEDFLAAVEDYCDERLVVRLAGEESEASDPDLIERTIAREMSGHHAELRAWGERLGQLGEVLSAQVVSAWEKIDVQLRLRQEQQQEQLSRWAAANQRESSEELAQTQRELLRDFRQSLEGMAAESRRIQEEGGQRQDEQLAGIERLHRRLQGEQQSAASAQREQVQALIGAGEGLSRTLSRLRGEASEARDEAARQLQLFSESIHEIAHSTREVQRELLEGQEEQARSLRATAQGLAGTLERVDAQFAALREHAGRQAQEASAHFEQLSRERSEAVRQESRLREAQLRGLVESSEDLARTLEVLRAEAAAAQEHLAGLAEHVGPDLAERFEALANSLSEPWQRQLGQLDTLAATLEARIAQDAPRGRGLRDFFSRG